MSFVDLEKYIRDIEEITDLRGSFLISQPDGKIIATTLVSGLTDKITSEIFDVEATFQQFSNYLEMGTLKHFILEGPTGIIIIKKIATEDTTQNLYYIGIGRQNLHLPLIKIALVDFSKKIQEAIQKSVSSNI